MPDAATYFDPLRRKDVAATPEERVRQWFICQLSGPGAVPVHMMMSEVQMKSAGRTRRADIVVYSSSGDAVAVVECKRPDVEIDASVAEQALRYHGVLGVNYIFLTNGNNTYIYRKSGDGFENVRSFPTYKEMCRQCQ